MFGFFSWKKLRRNQQGLDGPLQPIAFPLIEKNSVPSVERSLLLDNMTQMTNHLLSGIFSAQPTVYCQVFVFIYSAMWQITDNPESTFLRWFIDWFYMSCFFINKGLRHWNESEIKRKGQNNRVRLQRLFLYLVQRGGWKGQVNEAGEQMCSITQLKTQRLDKII